MWNKWSAANLVVGVVEVKGDSGVGYPLVRHSSVIFALCSYSRQKAPMSIYIFSFRK